MIVSRSSSLRDRVAAGILEVAATVLAERGEAASMADVADTAGVGRATLYRYFPSREALLRALADVALDDLGERIESATVIWAAGMRAAPLTAQIPAERDNFGRLIVDRDLRVPSVPGVFATGDAARAACDDLGNYALMSCQHATRMGAFAGNNAAAELMGVPTKPYHQKAYATCLDLGAAGAIFTRGWDRKVELVGAAAKKTKQDINTVWIYPPRAERAAALASADPEHVTDL